ncbi:hypothetical protein TI10_05410 [Photorhabdus luminescens subsp. luminescens]|uniref:Photorhabdus luminescens subsp. laumondii TTO1 complete genome segment 12/17 n=2 Tax=Photorhabdus TaxID=29487 RepID=Q7N1J0_PHOLL|nr:MULTISPECIES: hypothetical protein [Photorhabdus]AWK43139.1 hypothetical protein A4R40_17345 [Photorhabdus laumondii subsp. laumondii]AXG48453.1 hypothetical protein PluTT01m_17900 [Photorhabdus laumondii subsp. laumondii]KMW73682.1 hypothetical protein TI10_05410 [Photorhabdus luminescens subsp. luminescens]KTL63059.1 hypothetical protein AA106_18525 [Photorhabdus laumondii subsp. laumondii]MBS9435874.1 hypothetical protein [Photorhabdus noenieputensis]
MAARLEIIISFDENLNKYQVEWITGESQDITDEEKKIIAQLKNKLLASMENELTGNNQHYLH